MPTPYAIPGPLAQSYWGQLTQASPGRSDDGRIVKDPSRPGQQRSHVAPGFYQGGDQPPSAADLTPQMQQDLYVTGGTSNSLTPKQAQELQKAGWSYGQPAPKGYKYSASGVLYHPESLAHQIGSVAMTDAALVTTALTAGATSPWLAATIAGAGGVAGAKLQGASWKQALITGGAAAATAGLGASAAPQAAKIGGQAAINAGATVANGGSLRQGLIAGAQGAAGAATAPQKPGGSMPTTTPAASNPSLTNYLVQAGVQAGTAAITAKLAAAGQAAGQTAGNIASAREVGRQNETNNLVSQDQQRLQAQIAAENARLGRGSLDVNQRQESRTEADDALKQALRSALAMHAQDVTATRPEGTPTISFANSPRVSQLGAEGRQAAEVMNQKALERLTNPKAFDALPPLETFTPSELPKPSGVDTALGVGSALLGGLSAYQQARTGQDQNSLIQELIRRSQQQANAGVTPPAAPAPAPAVASNPYTYADPDQPWLGGY